MTPVSVTAPDGIRLSARAAGDPSAPALVFVHGWAQWSSCWDGVVARLSDRFHCVAFDLRGHGASDKPEGDAPYTDTALWGGDVAAVLAHFGLRRPTLVGWSYGARVIAAHLASQGSAHLAGVVTVGGILAIGAARESWMVGPESPALNRDLYTEDLPRRLAATADFVDACTARPLPRRAFAEAVGANMACPPHVRRALFAADLDFRDAFAALACPGLAIHGTADRIVAPACGEAAARLMPRGRYLPYESAGHAPFLDAPDRFAADLAGFAATREAA